MDKKPPIMLRAALSKDEWRRLRKLALDEGVSTSELVARLIRKGLEDGR